MHIDPSASNIIGMLVVVLGVGIAMRFLRQPNPVAYILAGLALGPFALGMVTETKLIERLGSYGVIFLLFFVGMEVSLKRISANWKIAFVGTGIQIVLSVAAILAFGHFWGWTIQRSVLMGFILSLSSTAMVIRLLIDRNEMQSRTGDDVLSILIVQDLAIIPMLVVAGYLSDHSPTLPGLAKQSMGGVLFIGLLAFVHRYGHMSNKILRWLKGDKELQLFGALFFSLGLAYVGSLFDLSSALGAFVAGIMITSIKEVEWFHHDLGGRVFVAEPCFPKSGSLVLCLRPLESRPMS